VYHTKKLDDILGIIMTDGAQQPQILLGVTTDDDWKDNIRKYFGIH
jgi:phosphotransferase system IIB component